MARADILNMLYSKEKSPLEFKFDSMWFIPMANILPFYVIEKLYNIATSIKLASKAELKLKTIKQIMEPHDFRFFHGGTNRTIYRHLECTDIVAKIAIDRTGMQDNPLEFNNQQFLKPFVTKTFEVSPCGTVGIAERVEPITSKAEFISIGESIFELLTDYIIGEYVLQDIGTKFFRNWGLRKGFGPVLLDYPYLFKLDGNKLFCNKEINLITGEMCGGIIDYDDGFNILRCKTCGKEYQARDLQKYINNNQINFDTEELDEMIVNLKRGNQTIYSTGEINDTSVPRKNGRNHRNNNQLANEQAAAHAVLKGGRFCSTNITNVQNEQMAKIQEAIAKDIATYNSIKQPNTIKEREDGSQYLPGGENHPQTKEIWRDGKFTENEKDIKKEEVPVSKYPIQTDEIQNKPEFNTKSIFMSPPEGNEIPTAEEIQAQMMANALGCEEDLDINKQANEEVKESNDISEDDYIKNKYDDLAEDQENFEKINKNKKIDISQF